ncbi:glycosyltransferase [bacterium]|nr:glycosyltransferase [bacterium]
MGFSRNKQDFVGTIKLTKTRVELDVYGIRAEGDRGEGIEEASICSRKGAKDAKGVGERETKALKLVFLGRVAPEKGIDVLLRALRLVKIKVELDVYGIGSDIGNGISDIGNAKVRWLKPVKPEQVVETIRKYEALVVPSVWLETGPLVVLEAFAAGVPVIGSRLGGIAEMVNEGVDGLLFHPGDAADLAEKLGQLPEKLFSLKRSVKVPRTTHDVGQDHLKIYRSLQ